MTLSDNAFPREHFVGFYDSDESLIVSIKKYLGLRRGVVIATKKHRDSLSKKVNKSGYTWENILMLDASKTLSKIMVDGMPDRKLFYNVIGQVLDGASQSGRYHIRAYGEMVALLWKRGNKKGAIRLEKLCNDLPNEFPFTLFCAYPLDGFGKRVDSNSLSEITRIVDQHKWADLR